MPQDETPGSKETSGPNTELKVPLLIETGSDGQRSDVTNGSEARNGIPHLPPVPGANRERASSEGVINGHPCMQRTMQALDLQVDCPLNKESVSGPNSVIDYPQHTNGRLLNGVSDTAYRSISLGNLVMRKLSHIMLEEVAPSSSSIVASKSNKKDWRVSLDLFSTKKHGKQVEDKKLPRSVRRYYKRQDELINYFEELQLEVDDAMETTEEVTSLNDKAQKLAKISFVVNLLLLIAKAVAAGLSGSLAIISSVIDSAVDLVSGALMWWSSRAMKHRDPYHYPQGRTKLEPIAIVILSVIMSLASFQIIMESIQKIIAFSTKDKSGPVMDLATILICCATIVIKLVLWIVCWRVKQSSAQALAQDHRNDVLSNSIALACGLIGAKYWKYADPIGAIVISIYIIISWFITGIEQIKMLTGHTARPDFLKKITWIALNHHIKVKEIDTVRAFHFGNNFLVEVDIVLPEEMSLKESHDIGESLQHKIERLPEVERAFVHLDYESDHHPNSEHKVV